MQGNAVMTGVDSSGEMNMVLLKDGLSLVVFLAVVENAV